MFRSGRESLTGYAVKRIRESMILGLAPNLREPFSTIAIELTPGEFMTTLTANDRSDMSI